VIAIGRYMLSALLMFAMIVDTNPVLDPSSSVFAITAAYLIFALALVILTWNDWWLDARLAGPAHAIDIITYTFLVFLEGTDDSPYFTFFIFILFAAAIRWGWRVTSLTAILLISLYLMAGMLVTGANHGLGAACFHRPVGSACDPVCTRGLVRIERMALRYPVQRRGNLRRPFSRRIPARDRAPGSHGEDESQIGRPCVAPAGARRKHGHFGA
jgi:hypothetical protein